MVLRTFGAMAAIVSLLFTTGVTRAADPNTSGGNNVLTGPQVNAAIQHDVSPPLRGMGSNGAQADSPRERPLHLIPGAASSRNVPDPALQATTGPAVATTSGLSFDGVGVGLGSFSPLYAPPDTNGAVGATQYVQWTNVDFAVFDKTTGALAAGFPKAGNSVWQGFGGGCEANNDGDPIVQYDKLAQRWILTQFSITNPSVYGYLQCVAVSTSSDATGTYNRYAFSYGNTQMPDYPKLGVWPDGYYMSYNIFNNGSSWAGAKVCAFNRSAMLAGSAATQQCFQLSTAYGGLLPSDLDGTTPPPAGSPNYYLNFGSNSLNLWKFHVDWSTPSNTTFAGPTNIPVDPFSAACNGGGTCIPQPGTNVQLDSLADRLMYRLAYRNFGDHESLVVNHSVTAGTSVGVRWYEIRSPNTIPTVFQQGTFAPDSSYRWMGSIAMDHAGDIALGYSVSSSTLSPSIRYTGRISTDTLGTMQGETTIQAGSGSQTGNLHRWGDYSAMTVDPVDDCTFWYTTEYLKSSGSFNWSTRIASFKFPGCTSNATPDFSISATPASQTVTAGAGTSYTVTIGALNGFTGNVSLAIDASTPLPAGANATFTPASVSGSGSSTLSVTTSSTTPAGSYPLTIDGTSGTTTHTANVTLVVNPAPTPDFTISDSQSNQTVTAGGIGAQSTVTVTASGGFSGSVALSASGLPSGVTAAFNPSSVTGSGTSTLTLTASSSAATGTSTVTITGTSGTLTHSTTIQLTVNPPPTPDFSLNASPSSLRLSRSGGPGSSTVTLTAQNGFTGTVALTVSGAPAGVTATLNPTSVVTAGTSTLQVTTSNASKGTYMLTITGKSGALTHTTTVSLQVAPH